MTWGSKRTQEVTNKNGEFFTERKQIYYSRYYLYAGKYDGRCRGEGSTRFCDAEGTFWRRELWNKVDGVDTSCNLACDWDL